MPESTKTRSEVVQFFRAKGVNEEQIPEMVDELQRNTGFTFKPEAVSPNQNLGAEVGAQSVIAGIGKTLLKGLSGKTRLITGLVQGAASSGVGNAVANFFGAGREDESLAQSTSRGVGEGGVGSLIGTGLSKVLKINKAASQGIEAVKNASKGIKSPVSDFINAKGEKPRLTGLDAPVERNVLKALEKNPELQKFPITTFAPTPAKGLVDRGVKALQQKDTTTLEEIARTFEKPLAKARSKLLGKEPDINAFNAEFKKKFNDRKVELGNTTTKAFDDLRLTPAPKIEIENAFSKAKHDLLPVFKDKDTSFGGEVKQIFDDFETFAKEKLSKTEFVSEKRLNDIINKFEPGEGFGNNAIKEFKIGVENLKQSISFGSESAKKALALKNAFLGRKDKFGQEILSETERNTANFLSTLGKTKFNATAVASQFVKADPVAITELTKVVGPDLSKQMFNRLLRGLKTSKVTKALAGDLDTGETKQRLLSLIKGFKGAKAEEFFQELQGVTTLQFINDSILS